MVLKAPTWKCKFSLKCRTHSKNTELKPRDLVVSSSLGLHYFNDLLREHNIEKLLKKKIVGIMTMCHFMRKNTLKKQSLLLPTVTAIHHLEEYMIFAEKWFEF